MNSPYESGSLLAHEISVDGGRYSVTDFDDYKAAPIGLIGESANAELVQRQLLLPERFANAVHGEYDGIYRENVVNFVIHSIRNRMHSREGQNTAAHNSRLYREPVYELAPEFTPGQIDEACEAVLNATASVAQNELARKVWGMSSAEYANLTLVGTFRSELEEPMWDEVSDLVGHDVRPTCLEEYSPEKARVLGFDRDLRGAQHIGAMRLGLKRTIGELDDGTQVKVRTAAIINTNYTSAIDKSFVAEMIETANQKIEVVSRDGDVKHETISSDAAVDRINKLPSFRAFIQTLIEEQFDPREVLARNETVYGTNPGVADRIKLYKTTTEPIKIIRS